MNAVYKRISGLLDRVEAVRPFSEPDAWRVYRAAALGEAFGWTLLITGLLIRHYRWPGHEAAVPVSGQIHGILFLTYFGVVLAMYTSLRWPRRRFFIAIAAGVPPYGSLVFEQWTSRHRSRQLRQAFVYSTLLASLRKV